MTLRDDLLDQLDGDRRRTVAALTDLQQTHLTGRERRDWGGRS